MACPAWLLATCSRSTWQACADSLPTHTHTPQTHQVLAVDKATRRMRVQAQITLKDLYPAATAAGLSVPRGSLPWWQGLTLGGIMATSSHGSGLNETSSVVSSGRGGDCATPWAAC